MESVKRAIGQFSAVLFGSLFFDEKFSLQKIIGIILSQTGYLLLFNFFIIILINKKFKHLQIIYIEYFWLL